MKTVLKFLTLGLILVAFGAISVTSTFAQANADECAATYQKFLDNRKGPELEKYDAAITAGNEYLEKCKDLTDNQDVKDYVTKQLPKVKTARDQKWDEENLYKPFNASVPAKDWDKAFNLGKQIVAKNPDFIDVMIVLASIGFDNAAANPPVDKFNADALNMAKMALQKINEGKTSDNWGAFAYTYKTKTCTDGKTNAIGWMNYTIGFITYKGLKNQKDGSPYLYKATQAGCETKNLAEIYRLIGAWYVEEFRRLEAEKNTKYAAVQEAEKAVIKAKAENATNLADVEKQFADAEKQYNDTFALQKGYMERVMDAYARAYKIANADPKEKAEYKNSLLNRAKEFYGFRYNKDMTGFDPWLSGLTTKPFPDPTSAVVPVVEATPTTTTTPGSMSVSTESTPTTTTDTRPRTATNTTATTAKPSTTNATTTATTKTATTTKKAPAKKPAKKKGTR